MDEKKYSWEPQKNCYVVRYGEEDITECKGKGCNCCGRHSPVENIHDADFGPRLTRARAEYHQARYNDARKGLNHVREKEQHLVAAKGTLENKMEQESSELLRLLFPR